MKKIILITFILGVIIGGVIISNPLLLLCGDIKITTTELKSKPWRGIPNSIVTTTQLYDSLKTIDNKEILDIK